MRSRAVETPFVFALQFSVDPRRKSSVATPSDSRGRADYAVLYLALRQQKCSKLFECDCGESFFRIGHGLNRAERQAIHPNSTDYDISSTNELPTIQKILGQHSPTTQWKS
ncbi:hypothetical protein JTB14_018605 [Gonioctena quinquepunctata]|nr:hypothetical protein JTB14_018605 [Gonioctena quinquepunctata]